MNNFRQYFPNFCDGFDPLIFDFETLEQFLDHEFIKEVMQRENFHKFAISKKKDHYDLQIKDFVEDIKIMQLYKKQGEKCINFYVLGTLKNDIPDLDRWKYEDRVCE